MNGIDMNSPKMTIAQGTKGLLPEKVYKASKTAPVTIEMVAHKKSGKRMALYSLFRVYLTPILWLDCSVDFFVSLLSISFTLLI